MNEQEVIEEFREFLHSISNRLTIAYGIGATTLVKAKKGGLSEEDLLEKLEKIVDKLDSIGDMIKEQRVAIINRIKKDQSN